MEFPASNFEAHCAIVFFYLWHIWCPKNCNVNVFNTPRHSTGQPNTVLLFVHLSQETSPSEEPSQGSYPWLDVGIGPSIQQRLNDVAPTNVAGCSQWRWQFLGSHTTQQNRNHTMSKVKTAQKDLQSQFTCNTVHNNFKNEFLMPQIPLWLDICEAQSMKHYNNTQSNLTITVLKCLTLSLTLQCIHSRTCVHRHTKFRNPLLPSISPSLSLFYSQCQKQNDWLDYTEENPKIPYLWSCVWQGTMCDQLSYHLQVSQYHCHVKWA